MKGDKMANMVFISTLSTIALITSSCNIIPITPNGDKFVPDSDVIRYCNGPRRPTHRYVIKLMYPLNVPNLNYSISHYDINSSGAPTSSEVTYNQPVQSQDFKTRLNLTLDLAQSGTAGKHEMVEIVVELVGGDWTFQSRDTDSDNISDIAITSPHENGRNMLCRFAGKFDPTRAAVSVKYKNNGKPFGHYNINLIVPETNGSGFVLPVTLDPEIKNYG